MKIAFQYHFHFKCPVDLCTQAGPYHLPGQETKVDNSPKVTKYRVVVSHSPVFLIFGPRKLGHYKLFVILTAAKTYAIFSWVCHLLSKTSKTMATALVQCLHFSSWTVGFTENQSSIISSNNMSDLLSRIKQATTVLPRHTLP